MISDFLGFLGAVLLIVAPGRDQMYRWKIARVKRKIANAAQGRAGMGELNSRLVNLLKHKQTMESPLDTFTLSLGALLLALSFLSEVVRA